MSKSIRLTVGQALVRFVARQRVERDGRQHRFIEGTWGLVRDLETLGWRR